ncbi:uncharacterized protein SAPINGB_P005115 [Magnusiomyces paraingens]|uniref:Succinate dehydrogenase assembly factor 4, mitochondrial n=1 Tax=Magnusiomyces paraingens TaxID=2606893 RepID=A0A5E8C5M5_9ASCO|nr:uncharacterized protein SAPINGB_P005115 [Saprochaete ingens]VVT56506.1 unnamed protein product [Saprochaete ingens]
MLRSVVFRIQRPAFRKVTSQLNRTSAFPLAVRYYNPMQRGPSPPRLPKEEQEEFEKLQREANVSRAFQEYDADNEELDEELLEAGPSINEEALKAQGLHPDFHYSNIKPDFEGDTNPVTGEVGGPKQDPLRHGDYAFNCRVTDF